jgi:hypothetical protein
VEIFAAATGRDSEGLIFHPLDFDAICAACARIVAGES